MISNNHKGSFSSPSVTKSIVDSVITIKNNSSNSYQVVAPSGATSMKITGNFVATEGPGDDYVRVMVMNSTGYADWLSTGNASAYYSGWVQAGTISATLPDGPGTYYTVYQSPFSLYSTEAVSTQANLIYTNG